MSAPVFSYAQAARGLAPSSQATSNVASSTSSEHGARDSTNVENSTIPADNRVARTLESEPDSSSQTQDTKPAERDHDAGKSQSKKGTPASKPSSPVVKSTSGKDFDEALDAPKEDVLSTNKPEVFETTAADSSDSPVEEKLTIATASDKEKMKDTDEDWEKISTPSTTAEKELKAAPVPVVNIWQQRREAQEAKMRELVTQRSASTASTTTRPKPKSVGTDEAKRRPNAREQGVPDVTSTAPRRIPSGTRNSKEQQSSQTSPRPALQHDVKASPYVPPSVGDTESWPTPEHAITDDRRRPSTVDKIEKLESTETKSNSQKKWTPIPFVPSVKFETQLPPAARRGGRPANRGRGGFNGQSDRAQEKTEPGSMGPPPLPNKPGDQDRGRKNNPGRSNRSTSLPTEGARSGSNDGSNAKISATPTKDPGNTATGHEISTFSSTGGSETPEVQPIESSQSPSRLTNRDQAKSRKPEGEFAQPLSAVPPETEFPFESVSRGPYQPERSKGYENFRSASDFESQRSNTQSREWARDRTSSSREKGENWRDRREPRPERGRGGFRARGNHSSFNAASYPYSTPLPQNGFENSKPPSTNEPRSRQSSQPFNAAQSFGGSRNNPRSQSIPISMMGQNYYSSVPGFAQTLSPIQTDMNFGTFGQMPSGIMSAMPYQDQLSSYALISMVITQL